MGNPVRRLPSGQMPGGLHAGRIAELVDEVSQQMKALDEAPDAAPGKATPKQPDPPGGPVDAFGQPLVLQSLDDGDGGDDVLEKAFEEGMLAKTSEGFWSDPDSPEIALTKKQLKNKTQELLEMYGVVDDDPWASAATLSTPSDEQARYVAGFNATLAAQRQPEESVKDYVSRLRGMMSDPDSRRAVAEAVQKLEEELSENVRSGKVGGLPPQAPYTKDYTDYLAAHGVDQRTLDAITSGELSMQPSDRMRRAGEMGLDPKATWFRWDNPLKTDFRGFTGASLPAADYRRMKRGVLMNLIDLTPSREGLVYASHSPDHARVGVQVPRGQITLYPLVGPNDGIAGIDRLPQQAYDTFREKQAEALAKKYPASDYLRRSYQRTEHLAEHLTPPGELEDWHNWRQHGLAKLQRVTPATDTSAPTYATIPDFSVAESRKTYTEPLMASGATGTLVKDETGLATAFTPAGARQLRRADLAPMDTRFQASRNILQSLLATAAIYGGVSAAGGTERN